MTETKKTVAVPARALKQRNNIIEIWRVVFAFFVMLCHSSYYTQAVGMRSFTTGAFGVEFFFIVSGFLLAAHEEKMAPFDIKRLPSETIGFVFGKIKTIFPYYLFGFILNFIVNHLRQGISVVDTISDITSSIPVFLGFRIVGFKSEDPGVIWYVSALIVACAIIFPLLRANRKLFTYCIAPIVAFFILGYMHNKYGTIVHPYKWMGFAVSGFWRGVAEMMLGCISFSVCGYLKKLRPTRIMSVVLSVIEAACYLYCCIMVFMPAGDGTQSMNLIICIFVAITITFSGESALYKLLNGYFGNDLFRNAGKFSLALYLTHRCWSKLFAVQELFQFSFTVFLFVYFAASIVSAFVCMFVCKKISNVYQKNKLKLHAVFFKGEENVGE